MCALSPYANEAEIVFRGRVLPKDIKVVTPVDINGNDFGYSIINIGK
jgi:hypothetical protein